MQFFIPLFLGDEAPRHRSGRPAAARRCPACVEGDTRRWNRGHQPQAGGVFVAELNCDSLSLYWRLVTCILGICKCEYWKYIFAVLSIRNCKLFIRVRIFAANSDFSVFATAISLSLCDVLIFSVIYISSVMPFCRRLSRARCAQLRGFLTAIDILAFWVPVLKREV